MPGGPKSPQARGEVYSPEAMGTGVSPRNSKARDRSGSGWRTAEVFAVESAKRLLTSERLPGELNSWA